MAPFKVWDFFGKCVTLKWIEGEEELEEIEWDIPTPPTGAGKQRELKQRMGRWAALEMKLLLDVVHRGAADAVGFSFLC